VRTLILPNGDEEVYVSNFPTMVIGNLAI
jgi:hypothetical protein